MPPDEIGAGLLSRLHQVEEALVQERQARQELEQALDQERQARQELEQKWRDTRFNIRRVVVDNLDGGEPAIESQLVASSRGLCFLVEVVGTFDGPNDGVTVYQHPDHFWRLRAKGKTYAEAIVWEFPENWTVEIPHA